MNVKNFIKQLDSAGIAGGLLDTIGLEIERRRVARIIGGIGVLAAGALVGVGVGLALAPAPGVEMRERARNGIDQLRSRLMNLRERMGSAKDVIEGEMESTGRSRRSSRQTPSDI